MRTSSSAFEGQRIYYGFLESTPDQDTSEKVDSLSRSDFAFDAVEDEAFNLDMSPEQATKFLSIIRIMTTRKRFLSFFGLAELPRETQWFRLTLADRSGNPPAWLVPAIDDYGGAIIRTNIVGLEPLDKEGLVAGNLGSKPTTRIEAWCTNSLQAQIASRVDVKGQSSPNFSIRAVDVGQASCVAIHVGDHLDSAVLGYYDVGAPMFFHHRSFPNHFDEGKRVPSKGFVALSHWDFDHYSLAVTKLKCLQNLDWYAPDQKVGGNAAALQQKLGNRLKFVSRPKVPIVAGLALYRGTGDLQDRNNSGYVLRARRGAQLAMLTGDVGYSFIRSSLKKKLTALGISHHGGRGSENPPGTKDSGVAVASYGRPNRYGHPIEANLDAHDSAGWSILHTAARGPLPRGDRWLV